MRLFLCSLLLFVCAINYGQKDAISQTNSEELEWVYQLLDSVELHLKNLDHEKAPALLDKLKDVLKLEIDSVSTIVNQIHAKYYYYTSDFERAAFYMIEAAKGYEKYNDSIQASKMYHNLSHIFTDIDAKKEMTYKRKALELCPESLDQEWNIVLLLGLSNAYRKRTMIDSSYFYLNNAYTKSKKIDYRLGLGSAHHLLSIYHLSLKDYKKVISHCDTLQKMYKENVPRAMFENSLYYEAEALLALNEYDKSLKKVQQSLDLLLESGMSINASENYQLIADIYEKKGDYKSAYKAINKSNLFKDSIFGIEKQKAIFELETKYETEKKEKENLQLKQESVAKDLALSKKNNWMLGLALVTSSIISLILFFWHRRTVYEKDKRTQIEQRLLRSQINPHFFFNVLTSIQQKVISTNERKESVRYISKFAKLMRQTLETSINEFIDLDEEIAMLENYIALQKIRYKSKFEYRIDNQCDETIKIPTQIIQPFVENAIEHGFKNLDREGKLNIVFSLLNEKVIKVEVIDNGKGFEGNENSISQHKSRAMQIIRERLSLFNDSKNYYHTIKTGNKGTCITIYSPFK